MISEIMLGLQGYSALSSLLGGAAARRRAELRRSQLMSAQALNDIQNRWNTGSAASRDVRAQAGAGRDALAAQASGLGGALSRAGVYNSSSVGGALGRAGMSMAGNVAALAARNADTIAQMEAESRIRALERAAAAADSDIASARDQEAAGYAGVANLIGALPSTLPRSKPKVQGDAGGKRASVRSVDPGVYTGASPVTRASTQNWTQEAVLPQAVPAPALQQVDPQAWGRTAWARPSIDLHYGQPSGVDPLQSWLQSNSQGGLLELGPARNSLGYAVNGMQNGAMPVLRRRRSLWEGG